MTETLDSVHPTFRPLNQQSIRFSQGCNFRAFLVLIKCITFKASRFRDYHSSPLFRNNSEGIRHASLKNSGYDLVTFYSHHPYETFALGCVRLRLIKAGFGLPASRTLHLSIFHLGQDYK
jgi:hypothetical protein